jgi:hypothetical protein
MSKFAELFNKYGYSVEEFGKSYIAKNQVFCIPFTEFGTINYPKISAISFLLTDLADIKKQYSKDDYIGCQIFEDWMNRRLKFTPCGGIRNHDHSLFEVESWLKCCTNN